MIWSYKYVWRCKKNTVSFNGTGNRHHNFIAAFADCSNRVAIIENEWKRLENYAWNVKVKSIDYNVKGGKTIISIDKNKADMMQSEADGVSLGIVQRKEKYNETLFDGFDAKDKQKFLTENLSGKQAWQMTGIFLSCISRCTA